MPRPYRYALLLLLFCLLPVTPAAGAASAENKPVIYFGVIPRYNPLVMYKRYQPIMDYLTAETPYRFELKIGKDYTEAVRFLKEGITQVSSLGDVTFAEANLSYQAIPILKPLNCNGSPDYRSAIIVRNESPIRSIKELKGKSMAFGSSLSTSGNLIPRYLLWDNGVPMQSLKSFTNLKHHDAVAKAILKGQFDAGAVKDVVAEKYKGQGIRVLAWSSPIPSVPLVVRRDAPPQLVASVTKALLALNRKNPRHAAAMKSWDDEFCNGFVPARREDYHKIFSMMQAIPRGCGVGCHK